MSIEHYYQAKHLIAGRGGVEFSGPFSDALVDRAEEVLGVRLPPSYRLFLQEYGCIGVLSEEIYGIVDEDLQRGPVPNGIWLTLDERKAGLDRRFVVLQSSGFGGWYALDTSRRDSDGECPVVLLAVSLDNAEDVAHDFGEFFLQRVGRAIEVAG
jgi:hypothetical protein